MTVQDGPTTAQEGSQAAQEGPKKAPGERQDGLREAQKGLVQNHVPGSLSGNMISGPPGRPKERQDGPKGFQNGPPNAQEGFKKRALGRLQKRLHLAATVSSMRPDRAPCLSHCGARPANTSDHPSLTIGVPGDVRPWPPNHARTGHRPSHPRFEAKTFPPATNTQGHAAMPRETRPRAHERTPRQHTNAPWTSVLLFLVRPSVLLLLSAFREHDRDDLLRGSREPLGGLSKASWALLEAYWGALRAIFGTLGGLLGASREPLGGLLWASWDLAGPSWTAGLA